MIGRVVAAGLTLAAAFGCLGTPEPVEPDPDHVVRWQALCRHEGCLRGSQDWKPRGFGEGSVMKDEEWQRFLALPHSVVVPFLIDRIDSAALTKTHVCPYVNAIEGELAVYALEHVLEVNWFAVQSESETLVRAKTWREDHAQRAIRSVLSDAEARAELKERFRRVHDGSN